MNRRYIEYKIAEYLEQTSNGLAVVVLYKIEYLD